ncbi:hypothetical protein AX15_002822 [Amanita polypyramis BW_CC]|nr:hypothetical protein AX15_002822 [Amanita polypyramis BW_CC]
MFVLRPSRAFLHPRFLRPLSNLNRPSPPPLSPELQREFDELVRHAQSSSPELPRHPDAGEPIQPEFDGDMNPRTGEKGGPKREPVHSWIEGDWSFKGRVSDF